MSKWNKKKKKNKHINKNTKKRNNVKNDRCLALPLIGKLLTSKYVDAVKSVFKSKYIKFENTLASKRAPLINNYIIEIVGISHLEAQSRKIYESSNELRDVLTNKNNTADFEATIDKFIECYYGNRFV